MAKCILAKHVRNVVNEQETYWVVNNFIWGWLLLPILQLGELIKQETSTNKDAVKNNTLGYFSITTIAIIAWCILTPLYKPYMEHVLKFDDVNKLFELVMVLFGIGNAFYTVVSLAAYWFLLKKHNINILDVEEVKIIKEEFIENEVA